MYLICFCDVGPNSAKMATSAFDGRFWGSGAHHGLPVMLRCSAVILSCSWGQFATINLYVFCQLKEFSRTLYRERNQKRKPKNMRRWDLGHFACSQHAVPNNEILNLATHVLHAQYFWKVFIV